MFALRLFHVQQKESRASRFSAPRRRRISHAPGVVAADAARVG
jgi:hypothetical protein